MGDFDPVMAIRSHWCDVLEQALECIICFCVPVNTNIYICPNGHDVCHNCKRGKKLDTCPLCKLSFTETRNRCMEALSNKFEEMKTSLLDPLDKYVKKVKTASQETQTEDTASSVTSDTSFNQKNKGTQTLSTDAFSSGFKTPRRSARIGKNIRKIKHND